jgi:hypothetical protein
MNWYTYFKENPNDLYKNRQKINANVLYNRKEIPIINRRQECARPSLRIDGSYVISGDLFEVL